MSLVLTFKEQLSKRADEVSSDIGKDLERIKELMIEYLGCRKFTINLIRPKSTMAVGGGHTNVYSTFIPREVCPLQYRQLFVDELKKLGFTGKDMVFNTRSTDSCDYYDIILRW